MSKEKSINICMASQIETKRLVVQKTRIKTNISATKHKKLMWSTGKYADSSKTGKDQ